MTAPVDKKGFEEIFKAYRDDTKQPMVLKKFLPHMPSIS